MLSDEGDVVVRKVFFTLYHNQTNTVSVTNTCRIIFNSNMLIIIYLYNWHTFLL